MYAIIETGGKQYRVTEGDVITVEKLKIDVGTKVTFDNVLIMGEGEDAQVGTPFVDGAKVYGEVVKNGKGDKVIIFKYKSKKDYRKKQGHRQPFTKVEITGVGEDKPRVKKEEPAAETVEETAAAEKTEAPAETNSASADDKKASMAMKKDELIAYAEEHGIEVDSKATKAVILEEIEKNM